MGFYKYFADENMVIHAPNFVAAPTFELLVANRSEYTYPQDGWYYFDSQEEAYTFFGYSDEV